MATRALSRRSISILNIALGVWLFISAFIWPHTASQFTNAWVVGGLTAIFAAFAFRYPEVRWGNTALGVWLFISVWLLPTRYEMIFWNHLVVGALIFLISLVPGRSAAPAAHRTI